MTRCPEARAKLQASSSAPTVPAIPGIMCTDVLPRLASGGELAAHTTPISMSVCVQLLSYVKECSVA